MKSFGGLNKQSKFIHLTPLSSQNVGGVNGTTHVIEWGVELHKDDIYESNGTEITILNEGRYSFYWNVGITQGGSARTTYMSSYKINDVEVIRGRKRSYSRGSNYGDASVGMNTEIQLTAGQKIKCIITIDDADASYVSNTIINESELIIKEC